MRPYPIDLRRGVVALAMTLAVAAAALVSAAPPAHAACLSAEVQWSYGSSSAYLVGPKRCLVDTPWNERAHWWDSRYAGPLGVGAQLWVPAPPIRTDVP